MSNVIEFTVRAIDDFTATMTKTAGSVSRMEAALAVAVVTATAYKAIDMAKTSLDNAESMGTAALKANMAVEEYSALAYAANQSNVEAGNLATGMKMLGKAMTEGNASEAGQALSALSVSARDASGELRPTLDVMLDVSDAFANAKDDANKTAYAMALFGRSGVDMIPMLNQGSEAITEMMGKAQKLGIVISKDFAASADQVNDNLATLGQVVSGSVNVAMTEIAPVIEQMTGRLIDMATEGDAAAKVGANIASGMKIAMSVFIGVTGVVQTLGELLGGLAAALISLASGEFTAAFNTIKNTGTDAATNIANAFRDVGKVWDENAVSIDRSAAKQMKSLHNLVDVKDAANKKTEDEKKAEAELEKARSRGNSIMESQRTEYEKHIFLLNEINMLKIQGILTADQATEAIGRENKAWEASRVATQQYRIEATDTMAVLDELFVAQQNSLGSVAYRTARMMQDTFNNLAKGVGDAVAATLVDGANLMDGVRNVLKQVMKDIISTYITMQIERLIFEKEGAGIQAKTAMSRISMSAGEAFAATWADVASNMPYGWAYGEAIAAGVAEGVMAGGGAYVAGGAIAGIAHGGMDNVPSESTFLLDKGERVLSPRQNTDLTEFLASENSGGGGLTIQNLTIHILESATNTDAFSRMDRIALRNALGQPIIDALNEMWKLGIQPHFASRRI